MAFSSSDLVKTWLGRFDSALREQDVSAAVELFHEGECFWRDLVSFTWNVYTAESRDDIRAMLEATLVETAPSGWELEGEAQEVAEGMVQALIRFETRRARGRGVVRIMGGKCWTLLTVMTELKGHEEKAGRARVMGVEHKAMRGRKSWLEERRQEEEELGKSRQPFCLVVGGGQAGIALGARLKRLGVPTIIVEKNPRPGDSWRNRYRSLCLHDPVWFDHLPYVPFPDHWPVFSPKDKFADWLEAYTKVMELVYWSSTVCKSAKFDPKEGSWEVTVERAGESVILRPKELVLATGIHGVPVVPSFPGADSFKGVQYHSSQYKTGEPWAGKRCLVVGSNNSAHDICADLWECGAAEVTMLQRSSSNVTRSETLVRESGELLYGEGSLLSTETADLVFASLPYKILPRFQIPLYERIQEKDATFYDALRRAGFLLEFGDDGSGLYLQFIRRGSGYYVDVGASQLVIDGEIKLKSGVTVEEVKAKTVKLSNGSEVEADLIVYATGYGGMNEWAAKLISQEVADKVGKCWGLGSDTRKDPGPWEREIRNMWKPTHQPGLWFHGGTLQQARYFSLLLGLQIKARMEHIPTPVYGLCQVHHTT